MPFRDRIKELRRVPARQLKANPKNWRTHPRRQQEALRGILAEVGFADALLVRELPDGSLEIVDGHLRAETTPDAIVPVLVLDLNAAEADKILATHDAITGMADVDFTQLNELLDQCSFENPTFAAMFAELEQRSVDVVPFPKPPRKVVIPESYQVVVSCTDEADQRALYSGFGRKVSRAGC